MGLTNQSTGNNSIDKELKIVPTVTGIVICFVFTTIVRVFGLV